MLSNSNTRAQRRRNKLRKINTLQDDQKNILINWNVYFGFDDKPTIGEITQYCTNNHSPVPLKFINNCCLFHGFPNNQTWFNMSNIENGLQSIIDLKCHEINK